MKAVLISIKPKWCELIACGKKTIEVRKTKPDLPTPFKCYIYCTKARMPIRDDDRIIMYEDDLALTNRWGQGRRVENPCGMLQEDEVLLNGKVIGEFVCDKVYLRNCDLHDFDTIMLDELSEVSCVSEDDLLKYADRGHLYGWHISNLVIYDKPKNLSEFYIWKKCNSCKTSGNESSACIYDEECKVPAIITRPPQSWRYVEECRQ